MPRARLVLVTPLIVDLARFPADLAAAVGAGDVASLIIAPTTTDSAELQRFAEAMTPIAQEAGVAVLILNDTRVAGRSKADGVHVDLGLDALKPVLAQLQPRRIVGAAATGRDEAMEMGEAGVDYLFFGRLDQPEGADARPADLDLAEWWAELFETPCIVMAGADLASVGNAAATGAEFVALRDAVWADPRGAAAVVASANALLDEAAKEETPA